MARRWALLCQGRVRGNTMAEESVFLVTLEIRECAGEHVKVTRLTAQYVEATTTTATVAATTAATLSAYMLGKLGKICICVVVIMYQMWRKRRQTSHFENIFLINTMVS